MQINNQQLRPYQREAVNAVYAHLRTRDDNPCVVCPTGAGKSWIIAKIASDAVTLWHGRVLILAHVKELLEQNSDKVRTLCPDLKVGIYSAGLKSRDTKEDVIVAGIQSVYNKVVYGETPEMTDELMFAIESSPLTTPPGGCPENLDDDIPF